jgi:hypothetical protein
MKTVFRSLGSKICPSLCEGQILVYDKKEKGRRSEIKNRWLYTNVTITKKRILLFLSKM